MRRFLIEIIIADRFTVPAYGVRQLDGFGDDHVAGGDPFGVEVGPFPTVHEGGFGTIRDQAVSKARNGCFERLRQGNRFIDNPRNGSARMEYDPETQALAKG